MKLYVLPYKMGSKSASALASHFNTKKIFPNRNYIPKNTDVVLNWGCNHAEVLERGNPTVLNDPKAIVTASNKILALKAFKEKGVSCTDFTLDKNEALQWLKDGLIVYCRTLTRASEGKGIVVATKEEELVDAMLYTKYFKNLYEYRIHVFNNKVIDRTQKRKMQEERLANNGIHEEDTSKYVRNHMKGWSFTRNDMFIPEGIDKLAIEAVNALGLDFGAVDIAWNKHYNQLRVFEVNTAIGFSCPSSTHFSYCKAISEYLGSNLSVKEYNEKYDFTIVELE